MKRSIILLATFFVVNAGYAQTITRFEYFIDSDPGNGNATSFTPPAGDSVTVSIPVNIGASGVGYHRIGLRARDANNAWSHTEFRQFFVLSQVITNTSISAFEYFIDTDPGPGNAVSFTVSIADSVNVSIPVDLTGVPAGFHKVGVRSKNSSGVWSATEFRQLFIVAPPVLDEDIVSGEYYIGDTDPGFGSGAPISIPLASDSISIIADTILNNLPLGQYKISIRFRAADGRWTHQESRMFTVCSGYGAQSEMIYQVEGNRVFFTNESLYQDTVSWKFGDGTLDTVLHPIKTYTNAGIYQVQLITGNSCGIDTLTEMIGIRGLQRVNPGRTGNSGVSTLVFEGFGFNESTEVKLVLGNQVFLPELKFFVSPTRIRAYFDLTGLTAGYYRAVATLASAFDTLSNAILIEDDSQERLTLDVPDGRAVVRTGRVQVNGQIINHGGHDAVMVPYFNTGNVLPGVTGVNMTPFLLRNMVPLQTEGIFQHTLQYLTANGVSPEVMFANGLDSMRNRQIIAYYRTRVPGHSSSLERVHFRHFSSAASFQTGAVINAPLLDSYAFLDSINTDVEACYRSFLKKAVEDVLNIAVNESAWNNCFTSAFDTLMRSFVNISKNPVYEDLAVPMQAGFSALLAQMAECPATGIPAGLGGTPFKRIIQHVMNNWMYLEDIDSLDADCIDTSVHVFTRPGSFGRPDGTTGRTLAGGCSDCPGAGVFPELCDQCLPLIVAGKVGKKLKVKGKAWAANSAVKGCQEWCESNSVDPNAKYGPGNNSDRKYINHISEVSYRISFENIASATAPAAYVEIRDTIDKSVFDIQTLRLGSFSWGDSIIVAEPNEQNVSYLKTLKPAHQNFLRIDATTDTAEGVITWKFWTVDTVTLQLTADPTQGFLPPNTDGVSGAGYVTFTIAPLSSVTNGTILSNRASIVFDENDAIETDAWEYRIDTLQPSSAVNSMPAITATTSFNVSWAGSDQHAGVDRYSIYVSINDSAYQVWKSLVTETSGIYDGQFGKTYKFFSVALDKAGNYEDPPLDPLANPDAVTMIDAGLPLDLLSFTANKAPADKVDLEWKTLNEQDVSHFDIQRSPDGLHYTSIAIIPAQNIPSGVTYNWRDNAPLNKLNYYRLRMVDRDNQYKYSPVRLIKFNTAEDILVFPTLVTDRVYIQSELAIQVTLVDAGGHIHRTALIRGSGSLDLRGLPAGLYFLRAGEQGRSFRIIKH